ncbi:sigma-54-dependent transcriptional regulator [Helicovermis profundi]|uniref:Stage 0 sporulation protein A homolog n=1 Tax=Helicovermis profundi TaxID=3065157 RepID=A0AAU9DZV2_9FIRM|nr:sigma-54 dependent transcriptional regulator [Clostridia bacterium S502]
MCDTNILIVEDERNLALLIKRVLEKEGYNALLAENGKKALEILEINSIDIIITDIKMPEMTGIELLSKIKSVDSSIEVIIMTAFATLETAINAIKMGARDYIRKPFNLEEIVKAVKKTELVFKENDFINTNQSDFENLMVSTSPKMKELVKMIDKISKSVATVYINGETGVGKELVARAIHENSDRKDNPFIKVNCSALPETLLESELFGYEKGAFTGAYSQKLGRFELADGGTIFLDEIGDISPLIQLKLLRVLQQKELERLGGTTTIPLDVRIITATNKNLEELVSKGVFRKDLYYRLNVIPLFVPPLRDRLEDLEELFEIFISKTSTIHQKGCKILSEEAKTCLKSYKWPGNVRELENIIERVIVITDGNVIGKEDLPDRILNLKKDSNENKLINLKESVEEEAIRKALKECNNNITKASEKIGLSRRSMHRKINKYNIQS